MVSSKGDEPRDEEEEEKDQGYSDFFYYTYGYTTGYLGMRLRLRRGENAPALRMAVRLPRTMREQRSRDSSRGELRDAPRQMRCGCA